MAVTVEVVQAYLGPAYAGQSGGAAYDPELIEDALTAETAAQSAVIAEKYLTGGPYPALDEALCRRVARNLALRKIPLAIQTDELAGAVRIGGKDPEVARLERPFRRVVLG